MNYEVFTKRIQAQIFLLSSERQLEFALKICKDLFFEYQAFSDIYNWGNPDYLMDGINLCERAVNGNPDLIEIKELLTRVDSVIPDMDDFGGSELGPML